MRKMIVIFALAMLAPIGAMADAVTLDWISSGNNPVGYYYVSPYSAKVRQTEEVLTLYCIDFNHEVAPPYQWDAEIFPLTGDNLAKFTYGGVDNAWTKYLTAAWLVDQLAHSASPHQQAVYQYAAWQVFTTDAKKLKNSMTAAGIPGFAVEITDAYNAAGAAVTDPTHPWTTTEWSVVRPTGEVQEFLVDPPSVPEPSTLVLLGSAIVGIVAIRRKVRTA